MDKCARCKNALWDYEEYYGTTQKEYFVSGCKVYAGEDAEYTETGDVIACDGFKEVESEET